MNIDLSLLSDRVKHWAVLAACTCILGYFIMHSVVGDNGMLTMMNKESDLAQAKLQLRDLEKERMAIETRARLLRPDSLDLDMLDERARALLGYTKPNEYVIYFNDK